MMDRRRALMGAKGDQWEDITFPLSDFSPTTGAYVSVGTNSIRVYNTNNGQYKNAQTDFSTQSGYEYKFTCHMNVTQGRGSIGCRTLGGQMVSEAYRGPFVTGTSIDLEKIFQHDSTITRFTIFSTWSTSEKGDVTVRDLKIYRRPI